MTLKNPEDTKALHQWCKDVIDDSRDLRRGYERVWWESLCGYTGDLWAEFNPHSKRIEEPAKPDHKVRLAINLIQPVIRTEYAKLLKNRPIMDCLARSADKKDIESAKVGDKMLNSYVEKKFKMPRVRRRALMWCLITGSGAIFCDYDDTALGDVDVFVDPSGNPVFDPKVIASIQRHYKNQHQKPKTTQLPQGDLRYRALGPMQWGWDATTIDLEDAAFCYVSEVYDCVEVYRRWGVWVEPSEAVKPNLMEQRILERADLTGTIKGSKAKIVSQELVTIHRLFIKPGHFYFPDGAEIVFTEEDIIDATAYPYGHGELPIASMGHVPLPGSRYPLSIVPAIKDPVLEISKTESQLIENRNLMGNPPWIEYDYHQLDEDALQNRPGLRIRVPFRPNGADPHPIEMPEMPSYIQELPNMLREHVQEIAGQGETSQGRVPAGARSGVAIAYLQEEDDTKLGPTVLEYEEMMERVGYLTLRNIAEKYDVPRTIRINKPHSEPEVFSFVGTMLSGVEAVEVQAGSALPRSKAARQQYILDLFQMGIESDPRKVKDMLELGEGDPEEWEIDMEQADRENWKMSEGQQQPIKDWFNHQAHLVVHRRFMKSPDYEDLPEETQRIFDEHDAFHQRFLTGVAMANQAGVPTPGQSIPAAQAGDGANNQMANQGGPAAQNGQTPTPLTEQTPQ